MKTCKFLYATLTARINLSVLLVYWPGLAAISKVFVNDIEDVLERILIKGDISIHLDDMNDTNTKMFAQLLESQGFVQHVARSIHTGSHTIDGLITRSDVRSAAILVDAPSWSDHTFITADLDLLIDSGHPVISSSSVFERRRWHDFDINSFSADLAASTLIVNPPIGTQSSLSLLHHWLHTRLLTVTASILSRSRLDSATSNCYKVPKTHLKFREGAFSFLGPTAWNNLSKEFKEICETIKFKSRVKTYWFTLAFTNILSCFQLIYLVLRLWSQGGDVTNWTILGCKRHIRNSQIKLN